VLPKQGVDFYHSCGLAEHLRALGVDRAVVAGFQSELCVDAVVRGLAGSGVDVVLARDAHSTYGADVVADQNEALAASATIAPASDITF
jgi:nicotinamidase-related amidase